MLLQASRWLMVQFLIDLLTFPAQTATNVSSSCATNQKLYLFFNYDVIPFVTSKTELNEDLLSITVVSIYAGVRAQYRRGRLRKM